MNREELLKQAKPVLFNTEMVRAILEGRKTVTRRVAKTMRKKSGTSEFYTPIMVNDILYVRETWNWYNNTENRKTYIYRADYGEEHNKGYWYPSIHMPKEAARIFLKVTDVRAERLQDMEEEDAIKEGIHPKMCPNCSGFDCDLCSESEYTVMDEFIYLWNSTIKKSDLDKYGWEANPWVWVIEFERVEV